MQTKNNKNLEYIDVGFEIKSIHDDDEEFFVFEGLASTFGNTDLVKDIVERGAFLESIAKKFPVILWQHDSSKPIGSTVEIKETEQGLFIRARLPKADTFVSGRVIPQLKVGSISAMSIGFVLLEAEEDAVGIRHIFKVDLKEVSLVTFPANEMALVSGFKSAPRSQAWAASEADTRVRTKTGSTDSPSDSYRSAFLWFDSKNADNFDSYKLPVADVVNGELVVIPKALAAAKTQLEQLDLPEADKLQVLAEIKKLEDEQPNFYNVEEVKALSKRDLEKALRESGAFSRDAAVLIAKDFAEQGEPVSDNGSRLKSMLEQHRFNNLSQKVKNYGR